MAGATCQASWGPKEQKMGDLSDMVKDLRNVYLKAGKSYFRVCRTSLCKSVTLVADRGLRGKKTPKAGIGTGGEDAMTPQEEAMERLTWTRRQDASAREGTGARSPWPSRRISHGETDRTG